MIEPAEDIVAGHTATAVPPLGRLTRPENALSHPLTRHAHRRNVQGALIAEEGKVQLGDSFGIGEEVDLDDLLVLNGEAADGERLAVTD
jgi:hypothetical protein